MCDLSFSFFVSLLNIAWIITLLIKTVVFALFKYLCQEAKPWFFLKHYKNAHEVLIFLLKCVSWKWHSVMYSSDLKQKQKPHTKLKTPNQNIPAYR